MEPPPTEIDGIAVRCRCDAVVAIHELQPTPGNPRKHPDRQIEMYAQVIRAHGWRRPLTVSRQSGLIVHGEGALMAARRLGLSRVPVEYQDFASPEDERACLLADNRLPDLATDDKDLLKEFLRSLGEGAVTGFTEDDVAAVLSDLAPAPEYPITARLNERHDYVVIFCDSETDWQFLKTLCGVRTERSFKNKAVGEGRAVPFARFLESLRENRHSIPSKGGDDDHAPVGA